MTVNGFFNVFSSTLSQDALFLQAGCAASPLPLPKTSPCSRWGFSSPSLLCRMFHRWIRYYISLRSNCTFYSTPLSRLLSNGCRMLLLTVASLPVPVLSLWRWCATFQSGHPVSCDSFYLHSTRIWGAWQQWSCFYIVQSAIGIGIPMAFFLRVRRRSRSGPWSRGCGRC